MLGELLVLRSVPVKANTLIADPIYLFHKGL